MASVFFHILAYIVKYLLLYKKVYIVKYCQLILNEFFLDGAMFEHINFICIYLIITISRVD